MCSASTEVSSKRKLGVFKIPSKECVHGKA